MLGRCWGRRTSGLGSRMLVEIRHRDLLKSKPVSGSHTLTFFYSFRMSAYFAGNAVDTAVMSTMNQCMSLAIAPCLPCSTRSKGSTNRRCSMQSPFHSGTGYR